MLFSPPICCLIAAQAPGFSDTNREAAKQVRTKRTSLSRGCDCSFTVIPGKPDGADFIKSNIQGLKAGFNTTIYFFFLNMLTLSGKPVIFVAMKSSCCINTYIISVANSESCAETVTCLKWGCY